MFKELTSCLPLRHTFRWSGSASESSCPAPSSFTHALGPSHWLGRGQSAGEDITHRATRRGERTVPTTRKSCGMLTLGGAAMRWCPEWQRRKRKRRRKKRRGEGRDREMRVQRASTEPSPQATLSTSVQAPCPGQADMPITAINLAVPRAWQPAARSPRGSSAFLGRSVIAPGKGSSVTDLAPGARQPARLIFVAAEKLTSAWAARARVREQRQALLGSSVQGEALCVHRPQTEPGTWETLTLPSGGPAATGTLMTTSEP